MESSTLSRERSSATPRHARPSAAHPRRARRQGIERAVRARVVAAFRRLAHGVEDAVAYARSVEFYRSSGHPWTRSLADASKRKG
jgi:hypothetical protein